MSPMQSIPIWTEENRSLHDAICQARVSKESANSLKQLLHLNKDKFLQLLDNEPRNSSHRATLNSNKAYINRSLHKVNKDFVDKALFLSDQLNVNEHIAAALLMRGTSEYSRIDSNDVDTAVLLYHAERGYILACLDVILKSAKDASISEEIRSTCSQFVTELITEQVNIQYDGREITGTFVSKIIYTFTKVSIDIGTLIETGSITEQAPTADRGKLGDRISDVRVERLSDERIYLVQILYHIASLYNLDSSDKLGMLKLLESAELSDPATSYMIIALVAALSSDNQNDDLDINSLDLQFIDLFHRRLMTHGSKVPVIKAVIVLQWVLYLLDPQHTTKVIGNEDSKTISEKVIQELLDSVIELDVFGFMNEYLLYFQQPNAVIDPERPTVKFDNSDTNTVSSAKPATDKADYHNFNADISVDFQPFVIFELEKISVLTITLLFDTLKKLKYKEEDTRIPVQAPLETSNALLSNGNSTECHDLQHFLVFLASVFRNRVNDGLIFWNDDHNGLFYFTRWLLDVKVFGTVSAVYDFFGSIATGDICAKYMFHFLKTEAQSNGASNVQNADSLFSWRKLDTALNFYVSELEKLSENDKPELPKMEEEMLLKFLNVLKQCVQYSKEARYTFWYDESMRIQNTLINFINCRTSTPLRAAVFDVLAAFCSPWGGGIEGIGRDISYQMWKVLENSEMFVSKRRTVQDISQPAYQSVGLLQELQAERKSQDYTETLSVVRLIGSAIHIQSKREALLSGFNDPKPYIPPDFGKESQSIGSNPFISLILDHIFISLDEQKYAFALTKWELTEACLMVLENSLISYNLELLNDPQFRAFLDQEFKQVIPNPDVETKLLSFVTHPGFQVLIRILAGGKVIEEIFKIIMDCAQKKPKEVESVRYYKQCLLRSLRILHRVLELQDTFNKLLIPFINQFTKQKPNSTLSLGEYTFATLPSLVPLGQLMLYHSSILTQLALLTNYEDQDEVCFLSVEILHKLSIDSDVAPILNNAVTSSPLSGLGSQVTALLSHSSSAEAIVFAASERLGINMPEITTYDDYEFDINNIPFWAAIETLSNTYNYPLDFNPRISTSVRLALLNLFLDNIQDGESSNLTEFFLGYQLSSKNPLNRLQETKDNKATLLCLHSILNILQQGVERFSEENMIVEDTANDVHQLIIDTHPILAEKCYELIYRLCSKESLSLSTLRYLRNQYDFFNKQFDAMSARLEDNIAEESPYFEGYMICADGKSYKTNFFKLKSKLHQRAWLLKSIALELHTTIPTKQKSEAMKLLDLIIDQQQSKTDQNLNDMDSTFSNQGVKQYQQPLIKMLEFISSLEFSWRDSLLSQVKTEELDIFRKFDPSLFEITNERGCRIFDIRQIYKALREAQTQQLGDTQSADFLRSGVEMESILSWAIVQNHTREIAYGKLHCLEAWKEVVQVILSECLHLIPPERQSFIIYELLTMLLSKLAHRRTGGDYDNVMLKSMSDVVLSLVHQLSKSVQPQQHATSKQPVEKLRTIFNGIVEYTRQDKKNTTIDVRGDMYSAMTSFLLYIRKHKRDDATKELEQHILQQITSDNSKILNTLFSDAISGLDIWKTTAFIALDALNTMALQAGSNAVQSFLVENNFLQYVIETIRSDDAALSKLLEQVDAPLLPLYTFEAKMSILLRFAMNPEGFELLYSNRIFDVLRQCQFMRAQQDPPTANQMDTGASAELADRYQRLMMPTRRFVELLQLRAKSHRPIFKNF
ncbi:nucleoporin Nup186/Nup192/Nup205 [Mycotypha africana]|uniref:nucleoporin Nup186/Nup192/Nup205 n=1 Tax=Mycotypha africana TaxID=64632 RepID=UPI0023018C48|nr:nucleoporin Nup186/Nup192/Nup205 [Mycotypha africana]KAI8970167.1 nucleoporin Nup186/Nup192/Nup205 [Mycotypha africana]